MKRNPFSFVPFFNLMICISLILVFSATQTGCRDNTPNPGMINRGELNADSSNWNDWVALDVKFNKGTPGDIRDMSVRAIEKLLVDSVNKMRQGKFPGFAPYFVISSNPWNDSLIINIRAKYLLVDSLAKPACVNPCRDRCGVCASIMMQRDTDPTGPLSGKYIESISTAADVPKF